MKKVILLAIGLCLSTAAFAQENLLKEAERGLRLEVPDHGKIASMLESAMEDPTTAGNVKTWYLAGKNAFQTWQTGWEQMQQGANPDKVNMSRAIINGFDYYCKALTMDTIIDAKGKVKAKYSKEIAKTLGNSSQNFNDAGIFLYEANDLGNAYRAWEIYTILPTMRAQLGKDTPAMPADSILAVTYYNMGIFALNADMKPEAMKSFLTAARYGQGEDAYNNALVMAQEMEDTEAVEMIATEAFSVYGKQNYIGALVNIYVKSNDYEKALVMINKALESNPESAILYNVKGILIENINDNAAEEGLATNNDEVIELYQRAVKLDPENVEALYNYGRVLANKAYKISDDAYQLSTAEFNQLKADTIDPLFHQAAEQLEKAIQINPEANRQAFSILKNIYYNLNDEENMNRIKELELE